MPSRRR